MKKPLNILRGFFIKQAIHCLKAIKALFSYQFPLNLWLFCSISFASAHAAESRAKKSRITNKGLKLILGEG
jgi:hypothetical protein